MWIWIVWNVRTNEGCRARFIVIYRRVVRLAVLFLFSCDAHGSDKYNLSKSFSVSRFPRYENVNRRFFFFSFWGSTADVDSPSAAIAGVFVVNQPAALPGARDVYLKAVIRFDVVAHDDSHLLPALYLIGVVSRAAHRPVICILHGPPSLLSNCSKFVPDTEVHINGD